MIKDIDAKEFNFFEFIKQNDCVVFLYPKMGKSGEFLPLNLKDKKGLTGCTMQSKSYESLKDEFEKLGFKIVAIGSQTPQNQAKFKSELNASFLFLNDEEFILEDKFGFKTFCTEDLNKFYFRQTAIIKDAKLISVHEVLDPASDAQNTLQICKNLSR